MYNSSFVGPSCKTFPILDIIIITSHDFLTNAALEHLLKHKQAWKIKHNTLGYINTGSLILSAAPHHIHQTHILSYSHIFIHSYKPKELLLQLYKHLQAPQYAVRSCSTLYTFITTYWHVKTLAQQAVQDIVTHYQSYMRDIILSGPVIVLNLDQ